MSTTIAPHRGTPSRVRRALRAGADFRRWQARTGDLLETLARRPTRVFTRDELLVSAFDNADTLGAVDTYVYYLRRKLGKSVIETVHGVGYRLGAS